MCPGARAPFRHRLTIASGILRDGALHAVRRLRPQKTGSSVGIPTIDYNKRLKEAVTLFEPVLPVPVFDQKWNLIFRPIVSIVNSPVDKRAGKLFGKSSSENRWDHRLERSVGFRFRQEAHDGPG